jgi:hypothetical protein
VGTTLNFLLLNPVVCKVTARIEKVKNEDGGEACITHGSAEKRTQNFAEWFEVRNSLRYLGVVGAHVIENGGGVRRVRFFGPVYGTVSGF